MAGNLSGWGGLRRALRRPGSPAAALLIPEDPRRIHTGPLDPDLERLRIDLRPHRRRLWVRRIVRRAWLALVGATGAELVVFLAGRFLPIEGLAVVGASIPILALVMLAVASARALPSLGETALAVDREGRLGDRLATALALGGSVAAAAGPPSPEEVAALLADDAVELDQAGEERRFVRRQRRDALASLRLVPATLFRPRFSRRPGVAVMVIALALIPTLLLPNPQDAVIAQNRAIREQATAQAEKLDRLADQLATNGVNPDDPRTRLAMELRDLARQLRDHPNDLTANLARLGAVEAALRSQLDPANEQRAAALSSLSRGLSRAATGNEKANPDGDPTTAAQDLEDLSRNLDSMTEAQQQDLARQLAELQGTASQASGASAQALRDAAQSLAQGDTAGAKSALDRLAQTLGDTRNSVAQNRDLTGAANQLQDSRRNLANSGQVGQPGSTGGQTGQGQAGQPGGSAQPGSSGAPGGSGQSGAGQPGGSGQPGAGQGSGSGSGSGQGSGQGQGSGSGQGSSSGTGSLGGGGSNASYLGSGIGGNGSAGGPVNPNRPSILGADLSSIFAPFDRLGKPGDPSYIAGSGGSGQVTQGNQQGPGSDPGSYVPYSQVFAQFKQYALTSLDRGYVPLSVKDYVRDYFSSLDPHQ